MKHHGSSYCRDRQGCAWPEAWYGCESSPSLGKRFCWDTACIVCVWYAFLFSSLTQRLFYYWITGIWQCLLLQYLYVYRDYLICHFSLFSCYRPTITLGRYTSRSSWSGSHHGLTRKYSSSWSDTWPILTRFSLFAVSSTFLEIMITVVDSGVRPNIHGRFSGIMSGNIPYGAV